MSRISDKQLVTLFLAASAIGLYVGWKNFWFLTDDAYIAFRYVSNSILGHGYTWNPEPFRPVEGYTSFLWIVILEAVWRLFGILPPQSANTISLGFSFLTLVLATIASLNLNLNLQLQRVRLTLVALLLVGLLLNRTFLTWSSSGLETSLFNFCFLAWIVIAVFSKKRDGWWRAGVSLAASLVYLSRPDGMLVVLATLILLGFSFVRDLGQKRMGFKWFLSVAPIGISAIHLLWRKSFYGEWLPNTYYAKHVAAWPGAGIRYLTSFMLEYGLWVWLIVAVTAAVVAMRKAGNTNQLRAPGVAAILLTKLRGATTNNQSERWLCSVVVTLTVLTHIGYYTLIIGGDHFESILLRFIIELDC